MPGLQLTKNADTFLIDPLGTVTINNAPGGKWKTDQTNKIVVTKNDNTTVSFDVTWEFNSDNQLVVSAAGKKFNFTEVPANVPRYETRNAVLVVTPNKNKPFSFELRGDWSLSAETHDLTVTINGKASTIDGFINDPRSRFMFHFSNKKKLLQSSVLGFVGTWSEFVDDSGQPRLKFAYKRDGQADGEFVLPKGITIDKSMNQLMYEYDKNGNKRRIQFVGTLMVSDDFTISYGLDRQTSSDGQQQVGTTTFTFNAAFKKNNFTGDLDLAIVKQDGGLGTTLSISGKFTAVIGKTSLLAGFTFEQNRAGNKTTTTFGFSGKLLFNGDKGSIEWAFTTDNTVTKTITLALNVDINVGAAQIDARLNLQMEGGQMKGVTFFLGVGF